MEIVHIMRKYITLMLLVLSSLGAMAQQFKVVENYNEFKTAVSMNENIRLGADIVLPKNFDMLNITYKGIIDGSGTDESGNPICHSLGGGENTKGSDKRAHKPIFKALEGATLKNLIISNFRLEWDDDDIGAVACTAKNTKFTNVIVANVSVFNDDDDAGAIVGKAENCEFRNVMGINNDVTVDGNRAGGFVGLSYNSFYCNCSNSAYSSVYADGSWGNAYAGGFVGDSNSDQFVFCINMAQIGALDDCVGGITGKSRKSYFSDCSNNGCIMHSKEADFINAVSNMKKALDNIDLTEIEKALEEQYEDQDFDIAAMAASYIGGLGLGVIGNAVGWMLALIESPAAPVVLTAAFVTIVAGAVAALVVYIDQELDAHDDVGGICGYCVGGTFSMCINYGVLICYDAGVGGIVGETNSESCGPTTITNCLNAGTIKGYEFVGGIFGEGDHGDIINHCLNVGEVNNHQKDGKSDPIGNFNNKKDLGTLTKNYYLDKIYDNKKNDRIPVTSDILEDGTVANLLNDGETSDNSPWHQAINDGYPVPDQSHNNENMQDFENIDGVYIISSVADLDTLRKHVENGKRPTYLVYINADIDCKGIDWKPIGTSDHPFSGRCFGDGHTISNLDNTNNQLKEGQGFFGVVDINTEVRDLIIGSGSIKGTYGVGAIIGCANHKAQTDGFIRIIGCGNAADITGNYDCGGLVGGIYSDSKMTLTIDNSYNMGQISGEKQTAALCGFGKHNATITGCWNSGKVTGTEKNMGFARGENTTNITVQNCYSLDTTFAQKGVSMFTAEDAKDGTLCYNLNGNSNDASVGLPWEQNIAPGGDAYPHYKSSKERAIYTDREISGNYGTVILPYAVQSNDSIRYYILESVTGDDNEAQFEFSAVDTLKAGTPAVFYFRGQKGSLYEFISICETFSKEPNDLKVDGWTMTGNLGSNDMVFTDQTYLESLYFISEGAVRNATQSLTVSPFRAYLKTTGPAPARTRAFFYDGGTLTSVQVVEADIEENVSKEGIFNLAGQPLGTIEKGFSIIDGKLYYFDE